MASFKTSLFSKVSSDCLYNLTFLRPKFAKDPLPDFVVYKTKILKFARRFMRHDWYWGFLKHPIIIMGLSVSWMAWSENFSNSALDYGENKDFFDRNRRLSQLKGDDDAETLLERSIMLERAVKKAQVKAYLAGDIVWKEAVHRSVFLVTSTLAGLNNADAGEGSL